MRYFYECGICDHLHPCMFEGDCRDNLNRFTEEQVEEKYGDKFWIVPMGSADYYEPVVRDMKATDLMKEFRLNQSGDWWGDTMGWWFAVAGEMYTRDLSIPEHWGYKPGISPKDPEMYETEVCEMATDKALAIFGKALWRYAKVLKKAGKDY